MGSKSWGDRDGWCVPALSIPAGLSLLVCTVSWMSFGAGDPRGSVEGGVHTQHPVWGLRGRGVAGPVSTLLLTARRHQQAQGKL